MVHICLASYVYLSALTISLEENFLSCQQKVLLVFYFIFYIEDKNSTLS